MTRPKGITRKPSTPTPFSDKQDTRYFLAIAYRKTGRKFEAERLLRNVLRGQTTRYEAICELGEIYYELAQYRSALDQFRNGIRIGRPQ